MLDLEHLADGSVSDRNFQALARLVMDTGGQTVGIRFGTAIATFAASRVSAAVAVPHGLGRTPVAVLVSGASDQGTHVIAYQAFSYTSTQFTVRGDFTDGIAPTGPSAFAWVAIG